MGSLNDPSPFDPFFPRFQRHKEIFEKREENEWKKGVNCILIIERRHDDDYHDDVYDDDNDNNDGGDDQQKSIHIIMTSTPQEGNKRKRILPFIHPLLISFECLMEDVKSHERRRGGGGYTTAAQVEIRCEWGEKEITE